MEEPNFQAGYDITDSIPRARAGGDHMYQRHDDAGNHEASRRTRRTYPGGYFGRGFDDMMFGGARAKPITTVRQPLADICRADDGYP